MPDIFRGIELDPLLPENSVYLLWMILGYLVTSSVLVVNVGRLGDLFGRVRMYNELYSKPQAVEKKNSPRAAL
jgi:hypothetical protein